MSALTRAFTLIRLGAVCVAFLISPSLIESTHAATSHSQVLSEISYERKGFRLEYRIVRAAARRTRSGLPTKAGYALVFRENAQTPKRKDLTQTEASFYSNAMNRILWANEYGTRKPSSTAPCRDVVRIKVLGDQTRICRDNVKLTGQSYGLLNDLRARVTKL